MNILRSLLPLILITGYSTASTPSGALLETLAGSVSQAVSNSALIPEERKQTLKELAGIIAGDLKDDSSAQINFICTHNSRRSHLSQIWAQTAATFHGIEGISTFSGGTETAACNPRTVRALRRAGFSVATATPEKENPKYLVQFSETQSPLIAFSKVYSEQGNPKSDFIAVMTCSHADDFCPIVHGSDARVAIPFVDPKVSDNTELESSTYDERCQQIARQMFYLMAEVKKAS